MPLHDELEKYVQNTFKSTWETRDGKVIPTDTDIKLSNDGVYLDAVCLYADIVGSTKLVDNYKDTFAAEVYKNFLYCASKIITSMDGQITAFDGDRVMGVFVGDYKNTNAAKSALKINYAVNQVINPAFKKQYSSIDSELKHCVGIDRSKLLVTKTGVRGANDLAWIGRAGNYAAKLSALREEGFTSWITKSVYDKMHDDAKFGGENGENMWEERNWMDYSMTIYGSNWRWEI